MNVSHAWSPILRSCQGRDSPAVREANRCSERLVPRIGTLSKRCPRRQSERGMDDAPRHGSPL